MSYDLFKDWLPSINQKTEYLFEENNKEVQKSYPAFMVNRAMSQYLDTVEIANIVNCIGANLDQQMQYDFYYYAVEKKKRFSKWAKGTKNEFINILVKIYGLSYKKAEEIETLFTDEEKQQFEDYLFKGGRM